MGCLEMDLNASGVKELLPIMTWERELWEGPGRAHSDQQVRSTIGTQREVIVICGCNPVMLL